MKERTNKNRKYSSAGVGLTVAILLLCNLASLTVIFGRMLGYSQAEFVNVMPINQVYGETSEPAGKPGHSGPAETPSEGAASFENSYAAVNPAPGGDESPE